MTANTRLKDLLDRGEFILAPGVFEMFSAKVADRIGFKALYMAGYGVSGSHLGAADAGLVTYRDMVERARTIASGISAPLIADAAYRRSQLAFYAKHQKAWLPVLRAYLKLRRRLPDTQQ